MKCNIGKKDKIIRVILGLGIILLGMAFKSWLAVLGLILIITAFLRWCPIYVPFGLSSCNNESR